MQSSTETPPEGVDYSRKWLVLVAIAMAIFLGTIDGSIVNVALPTLADDFGTSFGVAQWVLLGYLLTMATLTLGFGRLGDMVGKKPIFTAGFGVFTFFSVLAGLAPSIELLILARVFQAVGAAMVFALGFAIVTEAFPPSERGKALGINGAMVSVGIIAGPVLGGIIIDIASWRWIFLVNLPIGIIGTMTAIAFVPNTRPRQGQRFDWVGAAVFCLGLLSLLGGLTFGQEAGFTDVRVITAVVVAGVLLGAFIAIERRVEHPMVDLSIFSRDDLASNLAIGFIQFVAVSGLVLVFPFYLENVLGFPTPQVGLLLASIPVTLGIIAPMSGSLSDRLGTRPVSTAGVLVIFAGIVMATFLYDATTSAFEFVVAGLVMGAGFGLFQSPNNSAILGAVPPSRLGVTSGLLTINRITGQIVGIAVLGTIWAARTVSYAGGGTAESAPAAAQAAGLRDMLVVTAALGFVAVIIAVRAWSRYRRSPAPGAVTGES